LATLCLPSQAIKFEPETRITSTGALAARSGAKTGRSPGDKAIVTLPDAAEEAEIWRGGASPNHAMDDATYGRHRAAALAHLAAAERLYVVEGYAGWEPESRIKARARARAGRLGRRRRRSAVWRRR